MDAKVYLKSYGWKEGEALQKGGLKKPILVSHKKDTKGLGHGKNKDGETWWENLFDGHLKNLEVTKASGGISFNIDEGQLDTDMRKKTSPLYRMFVQGEGLKGTVGRTEYAVTEEVVVDAVEVYEKQIGGLKKKSGEKKEKKEKKVSKEKKEKKEKQDSKEKKDKKEKKEKTDKKDKKEKKEKTDKKDKKEKKEKKESKESKESKENGKKSKKDKDLSDASRSSTKRKSSDDKKKSKKTKLNA